MLDSYQREINYLRISITDRCNLRCIYCMPKEGVSLLGHQDILRYEEILRVVKAAVELGILKIRVTGGEPLVRRGAVEFLKQLGSMPELRDLSITTNGILLKQNAAKLREAGIHRVNVSLDSLNPERYREITRGGELRSVLEGIEEAYRAGLSPVKINVVPIKGINDGEFIDFAKLALKMPVQVRFIELMPLNNFPGNCNERFIPNDSIKRELDGYSKLLELPQKGETDGPASIYRMNGARGEIGFISSNTGHFCRKCNRLRLTADGCLRGCLFSDKETSLKSLLRSSCTDGELKSRMEETIREKPLENRSNGRHTIRKCARQMSAIGG